MLRSGAVLRHDGGLLSRVTVRNQRRRAREYGRAGGKGRDVEDQVERVFPASAG